ncbi:MAG: hypothetical protein GDA56_05470 [Hormoscilla sp. GM7CHS1pb]|nr:hypothetical protein [Hormoscilla sp. GM7CHS1pb]
MTNVNFHKQRFAEYIRWEIAYRENLKGKIQEATDNNIEWSGLSCFEPDYSESLVLQGLEVALDAIARSGSNADIFSFISENVFNLLSQKYNLQAIGTPDEDLAACLG